MFGSTLGVRIYPNSTGDRSAIWDMCSCVVDVQYLQFCCVLNYSTLVSNGGIYSNSTGDRSAFSYSCYFFLVHVYFFFM